MENEKTNILCSCCGKEIHTEPLADREEYLEVTKEWGYFSERTGRFTISSSAKPAMTG